MRIAIDRAVDLGAHARSRIRAGELCGPTAGLAAGNVQANLVILPKALAHDFLRFAQANPKPCPVLAVSEPGDPRLPSLGEDLDIRTDLPKYRVWRHGELVEEPLEIRDVWRDDLVSFALGCSFSFEQALVEEGIELRHMTCGSNVPMYRTNIRCVPAGPFAGPLVVSMRPMVPADAIRAVQITSRFPSVHGAPVHLGLPEAIGIKDLSRPDYGDSVPVAERRTARLLGLRCHAPGGDRRGQARFLHHPCARIDADHRPTQHETRELIAVAGNGGRRARGSRPDRAANSNRCRAQYWPIVRCRTRRAVGRRLGVSGGGSLPGRTDHGILCPNGLAPGCGN